MRLKQKRPINKTFSFFIPILMKLGELVVSICATTSPSFNKIGPKIKKVKIISKIPFLDTYKHTN